MTVLSNEIEESYVRIKCFISASPIQTSLFTELKRNFIDHINSKRRFSAIANLKDLIDVLEKRLSISPVNTECLLKICVALNDSRLFKMFHNHQKLLMKWRQQNFIGSDFLLPAVPLLNLRDLLMNDDFRIEIPLEVVNFISDRIGRGWVDLARRLKIKEGEIDNIDDMDNISLPDKARYILNLYTSRVAPEEHPQLLLEALTKVHRNDLKQEVSQMLQRSSVPYL